MASRKIFSWRRWHAAYSSILLARAIQDFDPARVRHWIVRAGNINPRIHLTGRLRLRMSSLGCSDRPRALDYVLAMMQKKMLPRHQHACCSIATTLMEHGARLTTRAAPPIGSLALVESRNLELLRMACANQPLWRMGFSWFAVFEGRPRPCRISYEQHCLQEGWMEGASLLRSHSDREQAMQECASLEQNTLPAPVATTPRRRL